MNWEELTSVEIASSLQGPFVHTDYTKKVHCIVLLKTSSVLPLNVVYWQVAIKCSISSTRKVSFRGLSWPCRKRLDMKSTVVIIRTKSPFKAFCPYWVNLVLNERDFYQRLQTTLMVTHPMVQPSICYVNKINHNSNRKRSHFSRTTAWKEMGWRFKSCLI